MKRKRDAVPARTKILPINNPPVPQITPQPVLTPEQEAKIQERAKKLKREHKSTPVQRRYDGK